MATPREDIAEWLQREDEELLSTVDEESRFNPQGLGFYVLEGHTPIFTPSALVWGHWFKTADRRVALTQVTEGIEVSTVFLGLAHQHRPDGPPLLFETMVFRHGQGKECERWSTWAEAEAGHEAMCIRMAVMQDDEP